MGAFQGLLSAKNLILKNNKISLIEENAFIGLKTLEVLDLGDNKLETLHQGTLFGLHSLRMIYLGQNLLTSLPGDVFSHLPRPLQLDVAGNPLQCDAALCWLKQEELNGNFTWLILQCDAASCWLKQEEGNITWFIYERDITPECMNKVSWDNWYCNETGS